MPEHTRVFEAGGRSTAVAPVQRQKPLLKSAQAKAAAKRFAATASSVGLPATMAIGVVLSSTKHAEASQPSFDETRGDNSVPPLSPRSTGATLQIVSSEDARRKIAGGRAIPGQRGGLIGKVCEDCNSKSTNYGLKTENYKRRWCKSCGIAHGASTRPQGQSTSENTCPETTPYGMFGIVEAFARVKKACIGSV
jgi:hypothetical protein